MWHVSIAPFVYFMSVTSAISTLVLLLRLGRSLRHLFGGREARP
jgi:hypothetical protein